MRRSAYLFFLTVLIFSRVSSQSTDANLPVIIAPSPNAASLGIYGQIPVSFFNGLPQISIPLGSTSVKNASIPIELTYYAGGVKPDIHPGWVGLNWNLSAGGAITRIVNNAADEIILPGYGTFPSYYANYDVADNDNWADHDTIAAKLVSNFPIFTAPDEFMFNFGPYSGSFFLDHKGNWQVKSLGAVNLIIQEEIMNDYTLSKQPSARSNLSIKTVFYKFSIITPDGCKYIFGGTPESIEFSRGDQVEPNTDSYHTNVIPVSWFLSKVISPTGQEIILEYERDGITCMVVSQLLRYWYKEGSASSQDRAAIGNRSITIINPSYLRRIDTDNQTIEFYRSTSTELAYNTDDLLDKIRNYEDLQRSETQSEVIENIRWVKLDSIKFISKNSEFSKKIHFRYYETDSTRLTLTSIQEVGIGNVMKPEYKFFYNTTPLPVYNSRKIDHWGFYNGNNYFDYTIKFPPILYTNNDVPNYTNSRNSNFNLMRAGALVSIKYPTGGTTHFEYEPHDYSMEVTRYPFQTNNLTVDGQCGGLRIKKITNKDAIGNETFKEYFYKGNYSSGGTRSSGIFTGIPQYLDEGSWTLPGGVISYWYWYDNGVEPLSYTNGNHVTYSEVTERLPDGSYSVFKYANHDQSRYLDTTAISGIYTAPGFWKLDPNNSKALDRGKLLEKTEYSNSNTLVKKKVYVYDEGAWRDSEAVRMMKLTSRMFGNAIDYRGTAYYVYTYPQFLDKEIDSAWNQYGNSPVVTTKQYTYSREYRAVTRQTSLDSKGDMQKTDFRYPFDFLNIPIYQEMTDHNRIAGNVEKFDSLNNIQISHTRVNYNKPHTSVYVPSTIEVAVGDEPLEVRARFDMYDGQGNILTMRKENDHWVSYIWDYHLTMPIAEASNASYTEIAYTSFESDGLGNWNLSDTDRQDHAITGSQGYLMVSGKNITKSGLTSGKKYIVSYWSKSGSVSVNSTLGISGPLRNGWTYWEHILPGNTTSVTISGTNKIIDELRLYPENARMTTYTYDPVIGMTSQCDVTNHITYYEYDFLGRLHIVKDQDKNIIRRLCYNFAGEPQECIGSPIYVSGEKTGNFRKNNCGLNQYGTMVTYTVPAGKYRSAIDTTAANAFAQQDVDENGQGYANKTGGCSAASLCYNSDAIHWTTSAFSVSALDNIFTLNYSTEQDGETFNFSNPVKAGQIMGGCRPSTTRTFTFSESGRVWTVTIDTLGNVYLELNSGTPPVESEVIHISGTYAI